MPCAPRPRTISPSEAFLPPTRCTSPRSNSSNQITCGTPRLIASSSIRRTGSRQLHLLQVLRHLARPAELLLDPPTQDIGRRRLALGDEGHPRRLRKPAPPSQDLIRVGRGRKRGKIVDLSPSRDIADG